MAGPRSQDLNLNTVSSDTSSSDAQQAPRGSISQPTSSDKHATAPQGSITPSTSSDIPQQIPQGSIIDESSSGNRTSTKRVYDTASFQAVYASQAKRLRTANSKKLKTSNAFTALADADDMDASSGAQSETFDIGGMLASLKEGPPVPVEASVES